MKKEDIKPEMVLRNKKTDRIGVPYKGCDYGCIDHDSEIAIVYRSSDNDFGTIGFEGTDFEDLEPYELEPKDMLTKEHIKSVCKPAKGKETCRYFCAGAEGFVCARVSGDTSIAHAMDSRVREGTAGAQSINCGGRYGSVAPSKENPEELIE